MISAGNDIVCLNATDIPRTKQPGFYSRILSPSEQALYNNPQYTGIPFEYFVWLLWSVKESAFKYLQRATPLLVFSPTKFIITHLDLPSGFSMENSGESEIAQCGFSDSAVKGVIAYADFNLSSRSLIYSNAIVSAVNINENFGNIYWGVKSIDNSHPDQQSKEVRLFLNNALERVFGPQNATINKNSDGIPFLSVNHGETILPVSLSHHGNFVGYSFPVL